MKVKEVEKIVGIKSANIRYYEKVGLLNPGRNTNNGYRDYTEEDILQLERIKTLRLINISTDDIKLLFEGGITMESTINKRLEELDQSEKDIKEQREVCTHILKNKLALDQLEPSIFEKHEDVWDERIKEVQKNDIDKHLLLKGCALMFGIAALIAGTINANKYMIGMEPATIWILPKVGIFFFGYAFVLLMIESKKDLPFLYIGRSGSHWKAPGLGILSNSFSFAGLAIGLISSSILQFVLAYLISCAVICSVRTAFMYKHLYAK